jgi:hypothetical protein
MSRQYVLRIHPVRSDLRRAGGREGDTAFGGNKSQPSVGDAKVVELPGNWKNIRRMMKKLPMTRLFLLPLLALRAYEKKWRPGRRISRISLRPETRRNRSHFAAQTRRNFLSLGLVQRFPKRRRTGPARRASHRAPRPSANGRKARSARSLHWGAFVPGTPPRAAAS